MRKWKNRIQLSVKIWDEDWRKESVTRWESKMYMKNKPWPAPAGSCSAFLCWLTPVFLLHPSTQAAGEGLWASQTYCPWAIPSPIKCEGDVH